MKVTAIPTDQITRIDGQPCRVWYGTTESGVHFLMFVARCAVPEGSDPAEFEAALAEMPAPHEVSTLEAHRVFSTRHFLN